MKTGLVLLAFLFSTHAFADDAKITKVTAICNLSDSSLQDDPNIETHKVELDFTKTEKFASYAGRVYEVAAFALGAGDNVRYELSLGSRVERTNAVVGSAVATFTKEIPNVLYQVGPNILFHCMQSN